MDKKYLATLPVEKIAESENKSLTAEIVNTKYGDVLAVTVYDPDGEHIYRIFIDDKGWHTLSSLGEWSKKSLGYILDGGDQYGVTYHYVSENDYLADSNSTKTITDYFKSIKFDTWYKNAGQMIQNFMDHINSEKSSARMSNKEAFENYVFSLLPPLPSDIDEWVRETILENSRYIFMQHKKSNSDYKEGYCSHCEQVVEISADWKHNETGCCPNCCSYVTYKSAGIKRSSLKDEKNFYIYQAVGRDVFIRFFTAVRNYGADDFKNFCTEYHEYARYYVTDGAMHMWTQDWKRPYYWGSYRSAEKEPCGWVKKKYVYSKIETNQTSKSYCELYNFDLDETFKGTCLDNMRFDSVKHLINNKWYRDIIYYMNAWIRFPFIEYFLKSGMYKLSEALMNDSPYNIKRALNLKGKKMHEILKVTPQDLSLIKANDYDFQDMQILATIRKNNYHFELYDFNYCIEFLNKEKVNQMLEYVTLTQLVNYINKQMKVNPKAYAAPGTVLDDWCDYIKQLIKLKYDLGNSALIRPKDLNEQHSQLSKLISDIADKPTNDKIKKRLPKLQEKFEYSNSEFMIAIPTCAFDIKDEGAKQNNCVASYVDSHARGETTILFLRRVSAPEVSFYTIEFKAGIVVQCRGYKNQSKSPAEREQVDAFVADWLKNKVNKKSKKNSKKSTKKAQSVA